MALDKKTGNKAQTCLEDILLCQESYLGLTQETVSNQCLIHRQASWCLALGYIYKYRQEGERAKTYFTKACELKSALACWHAGLLFERSGQEQFAYYLYQVGCYIYKDADNCLMYAYNLEERGYLKAAFWHYKKACDLNDKSACSLAEMITSMSQEDIRWKNVFLQKACTLKHYPACYKYGSNMEYKGNMQEAIWAYKNACFGDLKDACQDFKRLNQGGILKSFKMKIYVAANSVYIKLLEKISAFF